MNVVEINIHSFIKEKLSRGLIDPVLRKIIKLCGIRKHIAVGVIIVGERRMRALNRIYRHKDRATNILAFPSLGKDAGDAGDIILCYPVIAREARQFYISKEKHIERLLIHGFLHLLGFDHMQSKDAKKMETMEKKMRDL